MNTLLEAWKPNNEIFFKPLENGLQNFSIAGKTFRQTCPQLQNLVIIFAIFFMLSVTVVVVINNIFINILIITTTYYNNSYTPPEKNFKARDFMFAKIFKPFVTLFLQTITLTRFRVKPKPDQPITYHYDLWINRNINDPEYRTLELLHFLAARYNTTKLPPIDLQTLAELRDVTPRTIHSHLSHLEEEGLILSLSLPDQKRQISIIGPKLFNSSVPEHAFIYTTNNSLEEQQQPVQHLPYPKILKLQRRLAEVLVGDGKVTQKALESASNLITLYSYQVCYDQLSYLDRRCEIFQESPNGLRSRSGVLFASIKGNWSPPPSKPTAKSWYSEEEFNQLIEH